MQANDVTTVLAAVIPGQKLVFQFVPGKGKKGKISQDSQVSLIRFLSLFGESGWLTMPEMHYFSMMCVAKSSEWYSVPRKVVATVLKPIEDAQFYGIRICTILESLTVVEE